MLSLDIMEVDNLKLYSPLNEDPSHFITTQPFLKTEHKSLTHSVIL